MEKKAIKLKIPPKDGNERTGKNRNEDTPLILGKEKRGSGSQSELPISLIKN